MLSIEKLAEYFAHFPGIGPRQAKRFVYFLLAQDSAFLERLAREISDLKNSVHTCTSCHRFFTGRTDSEKLCAICKDSNRDTATLMIVEKDVDLENIERAGSYRGRYFILGGTIPLLERKQRPIRTKELLKHVERHADELGEIVLALSASPDGENTALELQRELAPIAKEHSIKITNLGRGLSTGLELEYSDTETIKNALKNRA